MSVSRFDMHNFGIVNVRVVKDPVVKENHDGSHTYLFKVAVDRDYTNRDKSRTTDFISFQGYVGKNMSAKVYEYVKQGNMIEVTYTTQSYTKTIPAKDVAAMLKKSGVANGKIGVEVLNAIQAMGLAKFDDEHNMLEYGENHSVTAIRLGMSSRENRKEAQAKPEPAEKSAERPTEAPVEPEPAETNEADQLSDNDLPF